MSVNLWISDILRICKVCVPFLCGVYQYDYKKRIAAKCDLDSGFAMPNVSEIMLKNELSTAGLDVVVVRGSRKNVEGESPEVPIILNTSLSRLLGEDPGKRAVLGYSKRLSGYDDLVALYLDNP